MNPRKMLVFIIVDLFGLLILLLFLAYLGMSHLMILGMGLLFLWITLYDLRKGVLSALFSEFMGFQTPGDLSRFKWVPVILSTVLLIISLPVLFEHGLINEDQRWAMQRGQFLRIALPALAGGAAVIAIAAFTIIKGDKK